MREWWATIRRNLVVLLDYPQIKTMEENFILAIDEAEEHDADADTTETKQFSSGYLLGLCMGAALANMPEHIWASPERHQRQEKKH